MTLFAVYNSRGCVGRCDARCYTATGKHCDCICGGVNHGKGKEIIETYRGISDEEVVKIREAFGQDVAICEDETWKQFPLVFLIPPTNKGV